MPFVSSRPRLTIAALAFLAALSAAAPSLADWPMAKHDAKRSSVATGTSDIQKPVAYWKRYLGGSIGGQGMLVADVDANGKAEVVYVTGGRVVASGPPRTVCEAKDSRTAPYLRRQFADDGAGS